MSGPDVWGPHGWKFIHYITLGYPFDPSENDKKNYYDFFDKLKNVIPCSICGAHFKEHMILYPLTNEILSDKKKFIEWGINMHNLVNKINGKRIFTFEEGFKKIQDDEEKCSNEKFSNNSLYNNFMSIEMYILIFVFITILIIILYKNYK